MKKILLTICMAGSNFLAFSQTAFIPGNLAVVRVGDGTEENVTGAQPVFIDEYPTTATAVPVRSIALPTTTTPGGNNRFVLSSLSSSEQEGIPTLSPDGKYLSILGYDADPGTATADLIVSTATTPFVPAIINSAGVVNTTSSFTISVTASSNKVARGAITSDGSNIWMYASWGGLHHTTIGSNTATRVSNNPSTSRAAHIFNGELYLSNTVSSSTARLVKMSPGLPTVTGASITDFHSISNTVLGSPNAFIFFDTDGDNKPDLLYTSNETATAGLQKFILVNNVWVHKSSVAISGYSNNVLRGLTGNYVVGQGAILYGTTASNLLKITDTSPISGDISTTSATIISLATAPENTFFKGVVLAPGSKVGVLPVELTSFNSRKIGNQVQLNWTTASEKNNSHFEILRSGTGKEFNNIGSVKGAVNSDKEIKYSYTDYNPLAGVNYYKLRQVDLNGESEESFVISETFQLGEVAFSVMVKENIIELLAYSEKLSKAEVSIADVSGKTIKNLNVPLVSGNNSLGIPVNNLQSGVYVVALSFNGQTKRVKFVK